MSLPDTRPAPYPATTRAKGWRFELDNEQIRQSDTWALAPADVRPWLLMLWMTAWEQTPCGSMPSDDALIAARIGMQGKTFSKVRDVLMRGWWPADDGRLYHDTIAARVNAMLAKKDKDRARKAGWRLRHGDEHPQDTPSVTPESRGTDAGHHGDSGWSDDTKHQAPSRKTKPPKPSVSSPLAPDGVDLQVWSDWIALRKAKKASVTDTVLQGAIAEADKAGMTLEAFLRVWCLRGTQGMQADWIKPHERPVNGRSSEPAWRAEQRERAAQFAGPAAARKPELEVFDDVPRLVG